MPMSCPKCGAQVAIADRRCGGCGASVAQTARFTQPAPAVATGRVQAAGGAAAMIERARLEQAEKDRQSDLRLRRRWVRHGIAGVIVFFVVRCLFGFATIVVDPLSIIWIAVAAVLLGFPIGYTISRINADRYRGATAGGVVTAVILGAVVLVLTGEIVPLLLVHFFMAGAIPGFAIGLHCELDR